MRSVYTSLTKAAPNLPDGLPTHAHHNLTEALDCQGCKTIGIAPARVVRQRDGPVKVIASGSQPEPLPYLERLAS